jgi:hypothetical protein
MNAADCDETDTPYNAPPTACPPGEVTLISSEGTTSYGDIPITITFQNTTHVSFQVTNTFESTMTVFTQYHTGLYGEVECLEEQNVDSQTLVDEYTAECMTHGAITIVNVWMADPTSSTFGTYDDADVPDCCYPEGYTQVPSVQYTFKLSCESLCPEERRRLEHADTKESSAEEFKGATKDVNKNAGAAEPSTDGKDGHFCVSVDYPCGDKPDHVHVCHYSARDGYKTYCVPEPDSDVLAFYPKDYCGACIGGYTTK